MYCTGDLLQLLIHGLASILGSGRFRYSLFTLDVGEMRFPTISIDKAPKKNLIICFDTIIAEEEPHKVFQIVDSFTIFCYPQFTQLYNVPLYVMGSCLPMDLKMDKIFQ